MGEASVMDVGGTEVGGLDIDVIEGSVVWPMHATEASARTRIVNEVIRILLTMIRLFLKHSRLQQDDSCYPSIG